MKVGQTKTLEWVGLGELLHPHQRLAQPLDWVVHHNKYQVLTEHVEEPVAQPGFHLTPHMMAGMYDYLRSTPPFKWWRLPSSEEVQFHVTKHRDMFGDHCISDKGEHVYRVSAAAVGTTDALARVMAHEMCHAYCDRKGVRSIHGAEFNKAADRVCRYHGFDRKLF